MSNVKQIPKQFNTWTNDEIFHTKFKRDVDQSKIEKFIRDKSEANLKIDKKFAKIEKFKI